MVGPENYRSQFTLRVKITQIVRTDPPWFWDIKS